MGSETSVRLFCADCHAAGPYECAGEARRRGSMEHDEECYCPCHEYPECKRCGASAEWDDCWQCGGEGVDGHGCGEDCCACLDPEDNVPCGICGGAGGWWYCTSRNCTTQAAQTPTKNG